MGRKGVAKKNNKKKNDDEYRPTESNSRDEVAEEDPEIQQLLEKIEKLNDAEEGAGKAKPAKKRARKSAEPVEPVEPVERNPFPKLPKGRRKASPAKEPNAAPIPWEPAETAVLTLMITGIVPVVKLPAEARVTSQYKGMILFLFFFLPSFFPQFNFNSDV